MRQSSEELFLLIKSMSRTEKGYFKKHSLVYRDDTDYIKLFDFIEKQKKYDERIVKRHFAGSPILKRFAFLKHYLYENILTSLRSYYDEISVDAKLWKLMHSIEILLKKGLHLQCYRQIKKAKKIALNTESHLSLLWLTRIEKILSSNAFVPFTDMENLFEIIERENTILDRLYKLKYIGNVKMGLFEYIRTRGMPRNRSEFKTLKEKVGKLEILSDPEEEKLSFTTKIMYYFSLGFYKNAETDFVKSNEYWMKSIQLFQQDPGKIDRYPLDYLASLNNYALNCFCLKNENEALNAVAKIQNFNDDVRIADVKRLVFVSSSALKILFYCKTGNVTEGLEFIEDVKRRISSFDETIDDIYFLDIYYHFAYFFTILGDYRKVLGYTNKMMAISSDKRGDLQSAIRMLNLVAHFELGNNQLLESSVKSTFHFLSRRENLYKTEQAILAFIKKDILKISKEEDLLVAFKKLKRKIETITNNPFEKRILEKFDIISWLESKIENRPMAEIMRGKAGLSSS